MYAITQRQQSLNRIGVSPGKAGIARLPSGMKLGFVISRYFSIYFSITGVKKIVRYTEDFVLLEVRYMEVPLY